MSVGPTFAGTGSPAPPSGRQSVDGSSVVTAAHGKYQEACSRGVLFGACDQGAGVTVQTSITTTAPLSLHNPATSGKRFIVCRVDIGYFSGTLTAGAFYHAVLPPGKALPSGGTTLTSTCLDVGYTPAVAAQGVALTGSTVTAGVPVKVFGSSLPILASTANNPFQIGEDLDGLIILEPGAQYQLVGVFGGAGSSPKISPSIVWEEIPLNY